MIKLKEPFTTPIHIKNITQAINENGFKLDTLTNITTNPIMCSWKNAYGNEAVQAAQNMGQQIATLRLWYIPGILSSAKIEKLDDNTIWDIVSPPDNIDNRNQILEIKVKKYVSGG